MNCIAILQARMGSARLPGKVLADLAGKPMLVRILDRLKQCRQVDRIVVATTLLPEDERIEEIATCHGAGVFRGALDDVVGRVYAAVQASGKADLVLHATGDNPLIEPDLADQLIVAAKESRADFTFMTGIPIGSGVDVYRTGTLERINREASSQTDREHLNAWLFDHNKDFNICTVLSPERYYAPEVRLTVDYPEDLFLVQKIYEHLGMDGEKFGLEKVLELLRSDAALSCINSHIGQKYVSLAASEMRRGTS